jgi:hypothetical protein
MKRNVRGPGLIGPKVNCVSVEGKSNSAASRNRFKLDHGQFADIAIEIGHEISPFDWRAAIARHGHNLNRRHEGDCE